MKPILFNTDMVRAILDGRKTVTRRVIKGQDKNTMYAGSCLFGAGLFDNKTHQRVIESPYKVGDVLYVRETWQSWSCAECDWECVPDNGNGCCTMPKYLYRASDEETDKGWRPSIHMPKEAARIFLKVTSIKAAQLRDMKLEDFLKEGISVNAEKLKTMHSVTSTPDEQEKAKVLACMEATNKFKDLWNSTAGKPFSPERYANNWYGNPYVWVIEFEVITADQAKGN